MSRSPWIDSLAEQERLTAAIASHLEQIAACLERIEHREINLLPDAVKPAKAAQTRKPRKATADADADVYARRAEGFRERLRRESKPEPVAPEGEAEGGAE